jgi:hypothetical protein
MAARENSRDTSREYTDELAGQRWGYTACWDLHLLYAESGVYICSNPGGGGVACVEGECRPNCARAYACWAPPSRANRPALTRPRGQTASRHSSRGALGSSDKLESCHYEWLACLVSLVSCQRRASRSVAQECPGRQVLSSRYWGYFSIYLTGTGEHGSCSHHVKCVANPYNGSWRI